MKNKLTSVMMRTAALFVAFMVVTTAFTIYVNRAAALGREAEAKLHVTSGDPAVLAGMSFNVWSDRNTNYYRSLFNNTLTRNSISFDETGQSNGTSYAQAYEEVYNDYDSSGYSRNNEAHISLSEDLELEYWLDRVYQGDSWKDVRAVISKLQIESSLRDRLIYDRYGKWTLNAGYLTGEKFYFTITNEIINGVIKEMDRNADGNALESYPFSLTSGIFRMDGETTENLFPIEIGSNDEDTKILDLTYIPQTNCLVLAVAENINEIYLYIYHLETGAAEKIFTGSWYSYNSDTAIDYLPYRFIVNDNFLTIYSNGSTIFFTCIETDKTAESIVRTKFNYDYGSNHSISDDLWYGDAPKACFFLNGFFYVIVEDGNYYWASERVFDGYRLNIYAFKESELVFSGYLLFSKKEKPSLITISDENPFTTENGWAARRYISAYKKK